MHDIVIRGGTIIDGTGKTAFTGDVAIADGRIAAVGGKQGPAKRDVDADGLLVTPGWVDAHTHYDGQAMWDPLLAASCWHGVTTVLFGIRKPELVHDMPAGGRRFVQRVEGYEATMVAGTPIFERGEHTGAMPGRLVRAGRESAVLAAE